MTFHAAQIREVVAKSKIQRPEETKAVLSSEHLDLVGHLGLGIRISGLCRF